MRSFRYPPNHCHNAAKPLRPSLVLFIFLLVVTLSILRTQHTEAGYAAYVVDVKTGAVLHARNSRVLNFPASLCKVMTLYLVFEGLDEGRFTLASMVPISQRAARQPASKIGLKAGDSIMLQDAILALTTKSANDVATALAEFISGSEPNFAKKMTERASALGMVKTTFRNASGLPNKRQKTTAKDLSILGAALYENFPHHTHYFSRKKFIYRGQVYRNHNKLLGVQKGVDGIKTGYIRAAGYNLMVSARHNGHHLIAVVLGGKTGKRRDAQMKRLLQRAYNRLDRSDKLFAMISLPKEKPQRRKSLDSSLQRGKTTNLNPSESLKTRKLDPPRKEDNDWGIQLGAFARHDAAERILNSVVPLFPKILANTRREISTVTDAIGTLYRARHVGLTEEAARTLCKELTALARPCMLAPPSPSS